MNERVFHITALAAILSVGPSVYGCECCPADVTGDGMVNTEELLGVLSEWGPCSGGHHDSCTMDIDDSGYVGVDDLLAVLSGWGMCHDHSHGNYTDLADWGEQRAGR